GNVVGRSHVGDLQLGATVETEPAHPQDEDTQGGQRQVAAGDGIDLTVGTVLALTRTEQQYTSQSGSSTGHVDDTGTGAVGVAQFAQPAATPAPGALDRVDEAGHDHRNAEEGPQLHALGHRTKDDLPAGTGEDHLEEEVGTGG